MVTSLRLSPMRPRDPDEPGRTASSLELFFDLVFVVAVSIAAVELHHELTEGHVRNGILSYALVFFAIWWAWMNFTWFATSFGRDDDWLYRVLTFVQMAGVLVLAAGIEDVYHQHYGVVVVGYVIMRVALVAQWLRASVHAGEIRRTTRLYAGLIVAVQALWLLVLLVPGPVAVVVFLVLAGAEISVPVVAEKVGGTTPWHPHHITERYGLFTLIVLGESLLASANAIIEAVHEDEALGPLVSISVLALVTTAALWWIYFWPPHHRAITSLGRSLRYGYVHYFVFAAAGAFSAGIEIEIDVLTDHTVLSDVAASFTVTVPIALFVLGIWWIALRENADRVVNVVVPVGALLVLLDPVIPVPFTLTAVIMALVLVVLVRHPPVGAAH